MIKTIKKKVRTNLAVYRDDIKSKGIYWSLIHRAYKIPYVKIFLTPLVTFLKPEKVIVGNHIIYIDKQDLVLSQELLQSQVWEKYQTEQFIKSINKGNTVVDIGAHIGYYTLLAAEKVGKYGHVFAFEPDPKNFLLLTKNIKENGYSNVTVIRSAVSSRDGYLSFYVHPTNTGDHSILKNKDRRRKFKVKTVTLDKYFRDIKKIDVIKMDVQGAEYSVLKGGKNIFVKMKKLILFTEFYPSSFVEAGHKPMNFLNTLQRLGYNIYDIDEAKKELMKISNYTEFLTLFSIPDFRGTSFTNLLCRRSIREFTVSHRTNKHPRKKSI